MTKKNAENLLNYIPVPVVASKDGGDGNIVLLKPRFKPLWLRRLVVRLKQPDTLKIHLDQQGSQVWRLVDGHSTLGAIALKLPNEAGENNEGKLMRLVYFVRLLKENRLIKLDKFPS